MTNKFNALVIKKNQKKKPLISTIEPFFQSSFHANLTTLTTIRIQSRMQAQKTPQIENRTQPNVKNREHRWKKEHPQLTKQKESETRKENKNAAFH